MIDFDRDLCFLDVETLGLDRHAPIWEFAAIRVAAQPVSEFLDGDLTVTLPWNSNQLSRRLGVDPDEFPRHTAMGDVQWCLAQWRQANGVAQ